MELHPQKTPVHRSSVGAMGSWPLPIHDKTLTGLVLQVLRREQLLLCDPERRGPDMRSRHYFAPSPSDLWLSPDFSPTFL